MANEASIIELYGDPKGVGLEFTVAAATAISAGTLLALTDPRTAAAGSTNDTAQQFAGIAAADKEGTDGATTLTAYTQGIFDIICAGAVTVGNLVYMSGANTVTVGLGSTLSGAYLLGRGAYVGKSLETGTSGEVIAIKVGSII